MQYAQLQSTSNFSFLKGASHPEELINQALALNYQALAITDECSLAGVVRAYVEAKKNTLYQNGEFKLIIGCEFLLVEGLRLIVIAPTRLAYGQLSQVVTTSRQRAEKGEYKTYIRDVIYKLSDCLFIWQPDLYEHLVKDVTHDAFSDIESLFVSLHKRIWIANAHSFSGHGIATKNKLGFLSASLSAPIVACGRVSQHCVERKKLQDVLAAIRLGVSVRELGGEVSAHCENHLQDKTFIKTLYSEAQIVESLKISEMCSFKLSELRYEYPKELVPPNISATNYLRSLVEQGVLWRWPEGIDDVLRKTIEKELHLIEKLDFEYYFLTVYEIVDFARSKNILCQGRGSAANSVVCFCLGITSVDPKEINLLFERFISETRNEPPDIDVDFEHERREEVIQHIYQKYGRERAAITAMVITYRHKSAIREVGKALGFDLSLIEYFSKSLAWWDRSERLMENIQKAGFDIQSHRVQNFVSLVKEILGFPRHLSQHVGGFLISEGPIAQLVPIENASMPDRTVIQWDKLDIEALGLLKIDVLALGMLSAIRKSFQLMDKHLNLQYNLATLPKEDKKVYEMLQQGDSVGVFQVESRAQMSMLPRLKPACFYDLVIQVAIVRPGPIQGDMVHPYLRRRQGLEETIYPSEALKTVLQRTLGVPIFQEQAISIAMVAAGFSAAEADDLRRAIANWGRHSQLDGFKARLIEGMLQRDYEPDFAERIWQQIMGFAGYGFPESHSASFALLVYVSSWIKCYHPEIFCCALLNSLPMGFYSPSQLVQDLKRHHREVLAIDIFQSQWDHSLEEHNEEVEGQLSKVLKVRLGFRLIKGLKKQRIEKFAQQRDKKRDKKRGEQDNNQVLENVDQLAHEFKLSQSELSILAESGALARLSGHRYQSQWMVQGIEEQRPLLKALTEIEALSLGVELSSPSVAEDVINDYKVNRLSLRTHPIALLRKHPAIKNTKTFQQLKAIEHGRFVQVAGLVTGRQRPGSAGGVIFITLEDETGNHNIIVWKDVVERQRDVILKARVLKIKGHLEREGEVVHVIAGVMEDLSHLLNDLAIHSRDFH